MKNVESHPYLIHFYLRSIVVICKMAWSLQSVTCIVDGGSHLIFVVVSYGSKSYVSELCRNNL